MNEHPDRIQIELLAIQFDVHRWDFIPEQAADPVRRVAHTEAVVDGLDSYDVQGGEFTRPVQMPGRDQVAPQLAGDVYQTVLRRILRSAVDREHVLRVPVQGERGLIGSS